MSLNTEEKRYLRSVVRRVHPDLFVNHPEARHRNSESLKILNSYLDNFVSNSNVEGAQLHFWVRDITGDRLIPLRAELPAWGSLGPLFYAFDLITEDQLLAGVGRCKTGGPDINVLSWLGQSAEAASKAGDEHEHLRSSTRDLRARLEDRFRLVSVSLGSEFTASVVEQRRQLEALHTLEACLTTLSAGRPNLFQGLAIKVYHPDSETANRMSFVTPEGSPVNLRGSTRCGVGQDGTLHVVADRATIQTALDSLDLMRARILTQVSCFWVRRSRDLTNAVRDLLGVQRVWCDSRTEQASQRFVLWAGNVFAHRRQFRETLGHQTFRYSLLVHCDESAPPLDFTPASATLQVRVDASPEQLMQFMCGGSGSAADEAAAGAEAMRQEEEEILGKVREVLGVRHVIRVCSNSDQHKVIAAAKRLIRNAHKIMGAGIDLRGASLAIDDCYEVWESGFISIPHNFRMKDLQPRLQKLLEGSTGKLASAFVGHTTPAQMPMEDSDASDVSDVSGDEEEPQTILEALQQAAEQRQQAPREPAQEPAQQWPGLTIDSNQWGSYRSPSPAAARAAPLPHGLQRPGHHRWGASQRRLAAAGRAARLGSGGALWARI